VAAAATTVRALSAPGTTPAGARPPVASNDVPAQRFYVETLGCPKNQVDSEKLVGTLLAEGLTPVAEPSDADLVVVNTCAFIEAARKESIDTILALDEQRR